MPEATPSGATEPTTAVAGAPVAAATSVPVTAEATTSEGAAAPSGDKSLMNAEEPAAAESAETTEETQEGSTEKPTPESYTDFNLPEGVSVDEKRMTEFKEMAATSGLSQEAAQQLLDKHHEIVREAAQEGTRLWTDLKAKWHAEINADPEIGGQNLPETKRQIAKLIDQIAGPQASDTRAAFDLTGAGDNPYVVRLLTKAAKALGVSESKPLAGQPGKGGKRNPAETMYPNQGKPTLGNSHLNSSA